MKIFSWKNDIEIKHIIDVLIIKDFPKNVFKKRRDYNNNKLGEHIYIFLLKHRK